jgi:phenylpropionate dioxygenase-like ring-hydroxylating dioxygenase large terminal subunit
MSLNVDAHDVRRGGVMYSPSAQPDFDALRSCWHPVALSEDVKNKPFSSRLLEEQIVVWRDAQGVPHALADLCVHRGTALSIGKVIGNEIMCAYHGWRYRADGACTLIPQRENPTHVPSKARVAAYHCQERYGLIWVSFNQPRWPIPEVPELEAPDRSVLSCGPYVWNADASRQLENFTDFGHFPWVHPGTLGDPNRVVVDKHSVQVKDGHVMYYYYLRPEPENEQFKVFGREKREVKPSKHSHYELHLPYTIIMRQDWGGADQMVYLFVAQPIGKEHCRGFMQTSRNYGHDQDPSHVRQFLDTVFAEDKAIVECQRPNFVPFDLADELHLDFDCVAVNYRKLMRATGLAKKKPSPEVRTASQQQVRGWKPEKGR